MIDITPSLKAYINKLIKEGSEIVHNTKGFTYKFIRFEDLNKVYVYRCKTWRWKRNNPDWESLGVFKINSRKKMRGLTGLD